MEHIEIKNLTFTYPSCTSPSLDNVNLSIKKGEFVTLCGKSGCGKSTLLRQLKPILSPHGHKSGEIFFDGADISTLSQREQTEKIGFVMQNPDNGIVCDKVWHELAFGLESLSLSQKEIRARVSEMAAFFGITELFHKNVNELSGGQKQLLNLASVMVMQPKLLILDEPTSMLDPISSHDFIETISKINKELGVTVILSEHRLEEAFPLSDRAIVMDKGKIIADGSVIQVGEMLKQKGSDMLPALPTPMKVFYSVKSEEACPVSVRDGRRWLEKQNIKELTFSEKQAETGKVILQAKDLWLRYSKELPDILKGLSIKVREKELYAIVGGNGAGKTTFLNAVMGIERAYRGSVTIQKGKKTACLPQNPQSLFVKNTVICDLWEMLEEDKSEMPVKQERINSVIDFCELNELIEAHPYDLSGGEQQRAALAKVLLCEPDILFLDEPTKGLDAHFKLKLAELLSSLKKSGVTIIMVSHDIEFCAKYADRVGMFFDGTIVSEGVPREFFCKKSFYTTSASRMSRDIIDGAVLDEDIIESIGGLSYYENTSPDIRPDFQKSQKQGQAQKIKTPELQIPKDANSRLSKRTLFAVFIILFAIPLTVFSGTAYFGDRKYYYTSLLIIFETLLPFVLIFEGKKPKVRELVIIAVMCGIAVAGRVAFAFVPQFKPVTALVIISGICLGGEAGFLAGAVTGFVSNMYFSQGPWTPFQMFSWGIIGFLAGILFSKGILTGNKYKLCIFGFFATLIIYGGIMNPANVIMSQTNVNAKMIYASYIAGFPMDMVHAVSTAVFLWFASEPMCEKLERIKTKYGLI